MKKFLIALVVAGTMGMVSCKKDNETKPAVKSQKVMTGEKFDVGGWD